MGRMRKDRGKTDEKQQEVRDSDVCAIEHPEDHVFEEGVFK